LCERRISEEKLNEKIEVIIETQKTVKGRKDSPLLPDASLDLITLLNMP